VQRYCYCRREDLERDLMQFLSLGVANERAA